MDFKAYVPEISGGQVIAYAGLLSGYHVTYSVIVHPDDIEQEWRTLQERTDCSYFQSWGWIGVWLKQIAADFRPLIVKVWYRGSLVGLGIFVRGNIRRRLFITSNALFLNEYPVDGRNMVIEYNGLLAERGHRKAVYAEALHHLFSTDAALDEVFLGAIDSRAVSLQDPLYPEWRQAQIRQQLLEESSTWAVDLESIDAGEGSYLGTLSRNRRAQIRRAFRLYEASGRLQLEHATGLDMALEYFSELKKMHTLRWQKAGRRGAFANPIWENFHRTLVESRFDSGEIQLLRVRNDKTVIGYLYNLVWRKHVYVLQTGFSAERDHGLMPGYVVHAMAIAYNKKLGMARYDLMHGDELYKKIICNQSNKLAWVVLQRQRTRFRLENMVLALKRYITTL